MSNWIKDWKAGALDIASRRSRAKGRMIALEGAIELAKAEAYEDLRRDHSQGDASMLCRKAPSVVEARNAHAEAVVDYETLESEYRIEMASLEAWRTLESTKRAEMGLR